MSMKRTSKDSEMETSKGARARGLKRIPRRHQTQPGEVTLADCKVRITIHVDADVLAYFKRRATAPDAAPYQTQINNELRRAMERDGSKDGEDYSKLLGDERFITAVAERVRSHV